MTTDLPHDLAPFLHAITDVMPALTQLQKSLLELRRDMVTPTEELELRYLISLTLLTHQRGQLLLGDARTGSHPPEATNVDVHDAHELLLTAQSQLVQVVPAFASFVVLQFVSEIGAILQAVRRHVPSD
jgi:hypothetical protein